MVISFSARLRVAQRDAQPLAIHYSEIVLLRRLALGSGFLVPLARCRIVLRHALPLVIQHSEGGLRLRVALFRFSFEIGNLLVTHNDP